LGRAVLYSEKEREKEDSEKEKAEGSPAQKAKEPPFGVVHKVHTDRGHLVGPR